MRSAPKDVGRAMLSAFLAIEAANPERLQGVFGNANWTDKGQMPDATLKNLIEHFSKHDLTLAAVPEDELGNGYEYLIKKFADDSGHTAQEFYTNRTLVHLMAQMLEPQPGESIYDPTCGTGGMLISCLAEAKRRGGDTRTMGLYGQELITITAAIARMNLVIHGVSDFHVSSGSTLSDPAFVSDDKLRTFDVVLANPPYSIKKWNRDAWEKDPWGRNFLGTPPQGRADYAFFQHILNSMDPETGRSATLFPHGVLFRNEEAEMRRKLIEADLVECVLGLGPGLFYNSPMEACVIICRSKKSADRQGKILFIDAVAEIARERADSFLEPENQTQHSKGLSNVHRCNWIRQRCQHRRCAGGRGEPVHSPLCEKAKARGAGGRGRDPDRRLGHLRCRGARVLDRYGYAGRYARRIRACGGCRCLSALRN